MFAACLRQRSGTNSDGRKTNRDVPGGEIGFEASNNNQQGHACRVEPCERLDPFALPLRFAATDHTADERVRLVELHRERVVLRRAVRGIKMAVNLPVAAYLGVAIRMEPPTDETRGRSSVVLEHPDPALSLPLYRAADGSDIVAEWQSWGRVLGLPLLVAEADGRLREPFEPHRRASASTRRSRAGATLHAQRGGGRRCCCGGRSGNTPATAVVHRGEREIIARN